MRTWPLLLTVAALAAACSDALGPGGDRPAHGPSLSRSQGPYISNAVRYRDHGGKPATGRSGSAATSVLAVLDGSGAAQIHVGALNGTGSFLHSPVLGHVQLKGYGADNRLRFTQTHTPPSGTTSAVYPVGMLARGDRVQVQTVVRRADLWRAGVVTVSASVLLAPYVHVQSITAPATAVVQSLVNIAALVRESNGDLGARADCVLFVEGQEVDRANGIWVDANDAVSCVFAHRFTALGTHTIEVRLANVQPANYIGLSTAATTTIDIVADAAVGFAHEATFEDFLSEGVLAIGGGWRTGDGRSGNEWEQRDASVGRTQQGWLRGTIDRGIAFPLTELVVQQHTSDGIAHYAQFAAIAPNAGTTVAGGWTETCAHLLAEQASGVSTVYLCSGVHGASGAERTTLAYSTYAGEVSYYSSSYTRTWLNELDIENVYTINENSFEKIGEFASYGTEYSFFVSLRDGDQVYSAAPTLTLETVETLIEQPRTCSEWPDGGGVSWSCLEYRQLMRGVTGAAAGES